MKRQVKSANISAKSRPVATGRGKPLSRSGLAGLPNQRLKALVADARALGFLDDAKTIDISARISSKLLHEARRRAGVRSSAKLLTIALALLALQDDFGERLLRLKGTVDPILDLEF